MKKKKKKNPLYKQSKCCRHQFGEIMFVLGLLEALPNTIGNTKTHFCNIARQTETANIGVASFRVRLVFFVFSTNRSRLRSVE